MARLRGAAARQLQQATNSAPDDRSSRLLRFAARHLAHRGGARRPPVCPPGWTAGPPDFVGLGVQKAGTSWWYRLITDHPAVSRCADQPKEVHYFGQFNDRPFTDGDAERYHGYFPRIDGAISGEWTPRYLPDFWTHQQLRIAAPDTRLLVLLRDPVERYRSGVTHEVNRGAQRGPIVAIEAMFRGLYHLQLTALLRHFPREQVLVLQYEQCRRDPLPQLARTYEFLGLDDVHFSPASLCHLVNTTPTEKLLLPAQVHEELLALYRPDVLALAESFPEIDISLWPNFRELGGSAGRERGGLDLTRPFAGLPALGHPAHYLRSVPPTG